MGFWEWLTGIDPAKVPRQKRNGTWKFGRDASADCLEGHVGPIVWHRSFGDWMRICDHCKMKA